MIRVRTEASQFVKSGGIFSALILMALAGVRPAAGGDWPEMRGPSRDGHVQTAGDTQPIGLPLHWSEAENIKWKTEIPFRGLSTPVVMGGQVWLTTATGEGHDFYALCLDADTGRIRVNKKLFHADTPEPLGNSVNSYATPSPVIEPGRVYVHFGSYGTACLDTATAKVLWQRTDLPCRHYRGPSSSPILFENLLIVTMDGVDLQYTVALDKRNRPDPLENQPVRRLERRERAGRNGQVGGFAQSPQHAGHRHQLAAKHSCSAPAPRPSTLTTRAQAGNSGWSATPTLRPRPGRCSTAAWPFLSPACSKPNCRRSRLTATAT